MTFERILQCYARSMGSLKQIHFHWRLLYHRRLQTLELFIKTATSILRSLVMFTEKKLYIVNSDELMLEILILMKGRNCNSTDESDEL